MVPSLPLVTLSLVNLFDSIVYQIDHIVLLHLNPPPTHPGSYDHTVKVWDPEDEEEPLAIFEHEFPVEAVGGGGTVERDAATDTHRFRSSCSLATI